MKDIDRSIENYAKVCRGFSDLERHELNLFSQVYQNSPTMHLFLEAPQISLETKMQFIKTGLTPHFHSKTIEWIQFLLKMQRLKDLPLILHSLEELSGNRTADLISTTRLTDSMMKEIQLQLNKATGKHYELAPSIDKGLIGGFLVKAGNRVFDGSIKNSLSLLKRQLGKATCS